MSKITLPTGFNYSLTNHWWQNKHMNKDASGKLAARNEARSHRPTSSAFIKYIGSSWAADKTPLPKKHKVAAFAAKRRAAVAKAFPGHLIVIAAGESKPRSNDAEYRYRPHSAFAHLTGWGSGTVAEFSFGY